MMTWPEYKQKYPLTRQIYGKDSVEKIRQHAFIEASGSKKMNRSQKQNAYYWGVVLKIMGAEIGYLPDEIHQLMCKEFLSYERSPGELFVKSTTKLSTVEFEDYLANVRRFAATELSIFIPMPNETEFSYEVKDETRTSTENIQA
jgi:hypothetical protein